MRFVPVALLGLILVCGLAACGGGGSEEPPEPSAPGVLRTLALQGQAAPETTGNFAAFETDPPMDVAVGGWSVFVANTTDAAAARCAYVAQPSGSLLLAFRTGETVPDADGGTISDIDAVWITEDGLVLAYVGIAGDGGGRTEGLLSARVSGGAIVDKHDVLYDQRPMIDVQMTGSLDDIVDELAVLMDDGWVFVPVVTTTAEHALLRVFSDGTSLTSLVKDGDSLATGDTFVALHALGVDPIGNRYTFVAERQDASYGIYIGVVGIDTLYARVIEEGDDLSEGVATEIPGPQPLLIDTSGRVLFKAVSSENEDHLCVGASAFPPGFLAVEGDVDTWTDGLYEDLDWLHNQRGSSLPLFMGEIGTNTFGISFGIFAATDLLGGTALAMWDTREVPAGVGSGLRFTSTYPGLAGQGRRDADTNGSFAFANVLNNGQPGAFWLLPGAGLFTIALGGQTIPGGGDTFDGLNSWRTTTATNVMLFRAPVAGAGSGIFRRGP